MHKSLNLVPRRRKKGRGETEKTQKGSRAPMLVTLLVSAMYKINARNDKLECDMYQ